MYSRDSIREGRIAATGRTWPVRVIVGGGRTPLRLGPLGSLPIPLLEGDVAVTVVE